MNEKQLQEAFIQFLALKSGAKTQQELEKYILQLGEEGVKQAYAEFLLLLQQQAQKAAKGAKLNYIKKLNHKCAEDEELVYFKKGGAIDCGCKKLKKGGEPTNNKKVSVVEKFKKACGGIKIKKHLVGGNLNGAPFQWLHPYESTFKLTPKKETTYNRSVTEPGLLKEVIVEAPDKRYQFDRRTLNIGGNRQVISEGLIDYYGDGNHYLGDSSPILAGRAIYTSPLGNDTLYFRDDDETRAKGKYPNLIWNDHGLMWTTDKNDKVAQKRWKSLIKNTKRINAGSKEEKEAFKRALRE